MLSSIFNLWIVSHKFLLNVVVASIPRICLTIFILGGKVLSHTNLGTQSGCSKSICLHVLRGPFSPMLFSAMISSFFVKSNYVKSLESTKKLLSWLIVFCIFVILCSMWTLIQDTINPWDSSKSIFWTELSIIVSCDWVEMILTWQNFPNPLNWIERRLHNCSCCIDSLPVAMVTTPTWMKQTSPTKRTPLIVTQGQTQW